MISALKNLSLKQLIDSFKLTDNQKASAEVAMVRGWLMEGIEALATEESFNKWIDTDNIDEIIAK